VAAILPFVDAVPAAEPMFRDLVPC